VNTMPTLTATTLLRGLLMVLLCATLGACDAGFVANFGSDFSIGGTVSGLPSGQSVGLLNNGRDALTIAADGRFVFGTLVPFNGSYLVTISSQPATAACTVANANGTVTGDVTNVQVTCVPR